MHIVNKLSHYSDWAIYFTSKIAVAICFWGIWRLGRQFLSANHTLIAILILEAVQYFSFGAIELNDNVLELAFWSIAASYFYTAYKKDRPLDWIIFGISIGLGLMTKYLTIFLLISLISFLFLSYLIKKDSPNKPFPTMHLLLALAIIFCFCLPHLLWLTENQFATLRYLQFRLDNTTSLSDHFIEPTYFALAQVGNFIVPLLIIGLIFGFKFSYSKIKHATKKAISAKDNDLLFLFMISFGPLFLSCLVAVIMGTHLHTMWGQPFLIWWGLLLIALLKPVITSKNWYAILVTVFVTLILSGAFYTSSMLLANAKASTNYPGRTIAKEVDHLWQDYFPDKPLKYVVGDRWRAGSVSHYSRFHPDIFIEADSYYAPWIDQQKLLKQGGIVFWDQETPEFQGIPPHLVAQFPGLDHGEVRTYLMLRDSEHKILYLGMAVLPPRS
jgi:4-amino-4-deoxy-L-arabinose transferase-like glycosyltransferase